MSLIRPARTRVRPALCVLAAAFLTLASCGGNSVPPPGTTVLTISSTNTRFSGYLIGIASVVLNGPNSTYAVPFPVEEFADLTRLTDIGELANAPAPPSGTYTSAQIELDFTTASIFVNNNGVAVPATATLPSTTSGLVTVTITFDPAHPLVVTQGESTRLHINFDLDAFNSVDLTKTPAAVTVQPYVLLSQPPADATPLRVRGGFVVVQDGNFIMNTRPFFDVQNQPQGAVTVNVTDHTYYNIDGVTYVGASGLAAMKSLTDSATVVAFGTLGSLSGVTPGFNATTVLSGTSVEAGGLDHFLGVVSARSGNTLTLKGAQVLAFDQVIALPGTTLLAATATVTVGSDTIVSEDGVAASGLSAQSISVGQQIDAGGIGAISSTGALSLDATAGQVRLTSTRAWGMTTAPPSGSLTTLDLLQLGTFAPVGYNFTGAGSPAVNPAQYQVNTGSLVNSGTTGGVLVAVDGIVAPFGAAPPNFNATAITKGADTQQVLVVEWPNGSTAPFTSDGAGGIVVNLASADLGTVHAIYTGPQPLDLKSLPASPLITSTGASGPLLLSVGNATLTTGVSTFASASAFASALGTTFNGTNKLFRLVAIGQYNSASNTFVAPRIDVSLKD